MRRYSKFLPWVSDNDNAVISNNVVIESSGSIFEFDKMNKIFFAVFGMSQLYDDVIVSVDARWVFGASAVITLQIKRP